MRYLILGASAGLGRCLAEQLAARGDGLILVASDQQDLDALSCDLRLRYSVDVEYMAIDLRNFDPETLKQWIIEGPGLPTGILFVAGLGNANDTGVLEQATVDNLITVNFAAGIKLLTAFMPEMLSGQVSTVAGIGSVAAIRGRRANMVYGAAKRGLEFYFESLRHRLADTNCTIRFYRVGFMRTTMLTQSNPLLPAVSADWVAARIIANLKRSGGVTYLPSWWRLVALILRLVPWFVFRRLNI